MVGAQCVLPAVNSKSKRKEIYVVDDCGNTIGFVASGVGDFVHVERVHSYPAGRGAGDADCQLRERPAQIVDRACSACIGG